VPGWFEQWEATLSRFRPESELSALNRTSGQWVYVSPTLFAVIAESRRAAKLTDGLVNPLILPALEAAGYLANFDPERFRPGPIGQAIPAPDWRDLWLDPDVSCVFLPGGARLDLGGIGKGWAAQQAAERLAVVGPCLVDAGGDLAARGSPDSSGGWLIEVPGFPDDDRDGQPFLIRLENSAIATSGTDYRRWIRGGHMLHHLIDPRTGRPADSRVVQSSVVAPDAVLAEAWAKAALIGGQFAPLPTALVYDNGRAAFNQSFEQMEREIA
jgi:thiamine biosynthesis lipoprotein